MICNKCNHKLPDDSEFCQYCGNSLEMEGISQETARKETAGEFMDSHVTHEGADFNLTDLESVSPKEAFDMFLEMQAEETVKSFKENLKRQPNNEADIDFGLVPEKPIYTLAYLSVDGENEYLNQLYTDNGVKIKWNRRGSTSVNGVNGIIDIFDTFLPSGEQYKTIYINMYGAKKSEKVPVGFTLNNAEAKRKQKNHEKEEKEKTKFCSRCGSVIDSETKKCTGCGKQHIKMAYVVALIVALILIVVSSIVAYKMGENKGLHNGENVPELSANMGKDENEGLKNKTEETSANLERKESANYNNGTSETKTKTSDPVTKHNNSSYVALKRTCLSALCENEVSGISSYCYAHKCFWPDCNFGRTMGGNYCFTHTCHKTGCNNKVTSNYKSYCANHTCSYPGCSSAQAFNSVYCLMHK